MGTKNIAVLTFKVVLGVRIGKGLADALCDLLTYTASRFEDEFRPKLEENMRGYFEESPEPVKKIYKIVKKEQAIAERESIIGFR